MKDVLAAVGREARDEGRLREMTSLDDWLDEEGIREEVVANAQEVLRGPPIACPSCGSVHSLADLQNIGLVACCPDRKGSGSYIEWEGMV